MKRRFVSIMLVMTMLMYAFRVCGVTEGMYSYAKTEENKKSESKIRKSIHVTREKITENKRLKKDKKKSEYLVLTSNTQELNSIKKKYKNVDNISSLSKDCLEKQNMAVLEMNGEEAFELQTQKSVVRVEKDYTIKGSSKIKGNSREQNSSTDKEWNLDVINVNKSMQEQNTERKVKVAIIDSGVDELNDISVSKSINLIPGEENLLPLYYDVSGHGTSVAGIIAAEDNDEGITGINPNVELYSAKVLDWNNEAPVSRVVEGIYWAISQNVDIINMSFGMNQTSELLHKAIQDAYEKGILLIAAAGNTGDKVQYPAAYSEVVAVGSVASNGEITKDSAKGNQIEVVAPGDCVKSTAGFETTLICSGTSMAAPHVTGVASLLWQKDLSMSSEFIRKLLVASSNCGSQEGYRLIDAEYAIKSYDQFKQHFNTINMESVTQEEADNEIDENNKKISAIKENDYVKGTWGKNNHKDAIGTLGNSSDLEEMKMGAVYPDISSYTKQITKYGAFHGRGSWNEHRMENAGNYIANTIYLSKIAQKGNVIPYNQTGMYVGKYSSGELDDLSILYRQLNKCKNNPNNADITFKENKNFLSGIAVHCVTDAYAHSAFAFTNNSWYRIIHPLNGNEGLASGNVQGKNIIGADDIYFSISRWYCAKAVAANVINKINGNDSVNYQDFMVNYSAGENSKNNEIYPFKSLKFKMFKLYQFASNTEQYSINEQGTLFNSSMWFWK